MAFIDRKELIEEQLLREKIRGVIKRVKGNIHQEKAKALLEERLLRKNIRKMLREAEEDHPHPNTGINVLRDLLKKIVPILEDEFKQLTTNAEQREAFRAQIITSAQNAIAPARAEAEIEGGEEGGLEDLGMLAIDEQEEEEEPLEIAVGDAAEDDKFIDIEDAPEEEEEEDLGGEEGDMTGRNFAQRAFEKIEKQIVEAYQLLGDEADKEAFYDYLITNLKLYFDKFEQELGEFIEEPTTPEYEEEKDAGEEEEAEGEEAEAGAAEAEFEEEPLEELEF